MKIRNIIFGLFAVMPALAVQAASFEEVSNVVRDLDPAILMTPAAEQEMKVYKSGKLPQYAMNFSSIFGDGEDQLEADAVRTTTSKADYFPRLPKLLHPNGVCVMGEWVGRSNGLSGAFAKDKHSLFIGRVSVAMQETARGEKRGFGFAGKLFPTQDKKLNVQTENFFSVDVLMGTKIDRFLDTALTNEPETGIGFDLGAIWLGLKIAKVLSRADENPSFRPVRNLAQMGLVDGETLNAPKWIRISADGKVIRNDEKDFRNEILRAVSENKTIVFNVDGSNSTSDRESETGWARVGEIRINEAVASYGCDRRLHFAHPKLDD